VQTDLLVLDRFPEPLDDDVVAPAALAVHADLDGLAPQKADGPTAGELPWLVATRGAPARLFVDNGSEFSGRLLDLWAHHHRVQIDFSRPGKPTENCFIETFNGSLRDECLNVHWFETMDDAIEKVEAWRAEYNESRPHQSLGELTPVRYAEFSRSSEQSEGVKHAGN